MDFDLLKQRADLLDRLRRFFHDRDFLEVETPLASREAILERHIELIGLNDDGRWLQASPEMHHKRLLCAGSGPIFEVTRSFRGHESGRLHNPEFTIVEWYRPGDDMAAGMRLLEQLLSGVLCTPTARRTSYRAAFNRAVAVDPFEATLDELRKEAEAATGAVFDGVQGRDDLLNVILSSRVEQTLGGDAPELLYHYPGSQAALAETVTDDQGAEVAERFELYYRGLELANGYHELTDPVELRRRLKLVNEQRVAGGAKALPLPERLLSDMADPGLPPCAGVALGFDRLVMLATGAKSISEVRPFAADR